MRKYNFFQVCISSEEKTTLVINDNRINALFIKGLTSTLYDLHVEVDTYHTYDMSVLVLITLIC